MPLKFLKNYQMLKSPSYPKRKKTETNTKYAQGGLAVVMDLDTDNFQKHIDDTMRAGDYEKTIEVVEMVIKEISDRFREIVEWGVNFDKKKTVNLNSEEKVVTPNLELFTIKILLGPK